MAEERLHWGLRVAARRSDSGRLSRCLALAEALERIGQPVRFFIDQPAAARPDIVRRLPKWQPEPDPADARALLAAIAAGEIDACIFDGESFDSKCIERAANYVLSVEIDEGYRQPSGHVIVNPGLTADAARYSLASDCVLCGVGFAPLSRSVADARRAAQLRLADGAASDPADRLLVTLDTAETTEGAALVLDALSLIPKRGVVIVILDSRAPRLDAIMRRVTAMEAVMAEIDVEDLADYYQASDLVIGDGSALLLERMCCGMPSISLAMTAEQQRTVARAAALGATLDGGSVRSQGKLTLAQPILELIADDDRRRNMAMAGLDLVDGLGADRLADALIDLHRRLGTE